MIESNYGSPGNLELIARIGDTLQFFWRDSGPAFNWNGPYQFETGVTGIPTMIQSRLVVIDKPPSSNAPDMNGGLLT